MPPLNCVTFFEQRLLKLHRGCRIIMVLQTFIYIFFLFLPSSNYVELYADNLQYLLCMVWYGMVWHWILFYPIVSYHIVYRIVSYHVLPYPILSHCIASHRILSYPIILYPVLSNHIVSYWILLYPIVSYISCLFSQCRFAAQIISPCIFFYPSLWKPSTGIQPALSRHLVPRHSTAPMFFALWCLPE